MAALDGTLALPQVHDVAVLVAQKLDLDMAGILDQLFDVKGGIVERALGFAGGIAKGGLQLGIVVHPAHAFASPARHGFEQDREAVLAA